MASNLINAKSNSLSCRYMPACLSAPVTYHQLFLIALACVSVGCSCIVFCLCHFPGLGHCTRDIWVSCCYIFFSNSAWRWCDGDPIPVIHMWDWRKLFSIFLYHNTYLLTVKGAINLYQCLKYWSKYFETSPVELRWESDYRPHFWRAGCYVPASYP